MTEACSGAYGDFSAVSWYHVPGEAFKWEGQIVSGLWQSAGNHIVLADSALDVGSVVRHEMLHALVRGRSHPRAQFLGRCAALVDCPGVCITDAGVWHAPAPYALLAPDSFAVSQQITALAPEADGARWVSVLVSARNPTSRAVVVAPPPLLTVAPRFLNHIGVKGYGGMSEEQAMHDSSEIYFAPGEMKLWLYEYRVTSYVDLSHVRPGLVISWPAFARHRASPDSVMVAP